MSNAVKELRERQAALTTAVASLKARHASARATLPVPVPAGGDVMALGAEQLALDLAHQGRIALGAAWAASDPQVRQNEIGAAVKLSHAFAAISAALDRRQGRGATQKVVVERVVVQGGGQAVVGAVTGGRGAPAIEGGPGGN